MRPARMICYSTVTLGENEVPNIHLDRHILYYDGSRMMIVAELAVQRVCGFP